MIYIYKTVLVKVLLKTSEDNLPKLSYLIELTSVIKVNLFITSVNMATIQDVQKKIDTKFKTFKLLEKDTFRIYERNNESELIKQQLYEKRLDEVNSLKMEILEAMIKKN